MHRIIAIATVALALAASAGAAHAQDTDLPTAKVSYADLDLRDASGRATLGARVARAVGLVCGERPAPVELDRTVAWSHCRATARASADQQLAALYRGERFAESSVQVKASRH
jgi:UrcA family protein